jgi:hypothetical protein
MQRVLTRIEDQLVLISLMRSYFALVTEVHIASRLRLRFSCGAPSLLTVMAKQVAVELRFERA